VLIRRQLGIEREVRHADDAVHRRADLMAHVGEELAFGAARLLGGLARVQRFLLGELAIGAVTRDGKKTDRLAGLVAVERHRLFVEPRRTVGTGSLELEPLVGTSGPVDLRIDLDERLARSALITSE
jgi:hypothetical protein